MKDDNTMLILKGGVETADYKMQELEEYNGNPFLEALPRIFSEDDVIDSLSVISHVNEEDRNKPKKIRYHIIKRLKNFIQPLPIHFTIESRLSTMIRRGYLARNPIDKSYLKRIRILNELRSTDGDIGAGNVEEYMSYMRSTADIMTIIGISGIGKTTAVERILLMYPQVIRHTEYGSEAFSKTQIVWLKIDCPYDGSLSTLCKSFFKAIDDILGTRYLEKYGYTNRVTSSMMLHMTALASIYGIGILVIDEIQQLLNAKNNMDEMLNFFVTLSNTVGVPTVLIGTSKAQELFKGNFRQARRAASEGAIMWDRMAENDIEWDFFIETMWEMQCLKNFTELTSKIKNAFYDETQGITSVAVNLFILMQERALSENKEEITVELIRTTAKEDLKILQPMLKALRSNNLREILKYEDISINLEALTINYSRDIELIGKLEESFKERKKNIELQQKDRIESLVIELEQVGIFNELNISDYKMIAKNLVESKPLNIDYNELKKLCIIKALQLNDNRKEEREKSVFKEVKRKALLEIYDKSIKNKQHPYEGLKEQGYIKDPMVEFL